MPSIFSPATALMSRLKFPQRFALITLLFLLPLAYSLFTLLSTINSQLAFSQKEASGTAYLRPLTSLYRHINDHYLASQVAIQTNRPSTPALQQTQPLIDADFAALSTLDSLYGPSLATSSRLADISAAWQSIKSSPQSPALQQQYPSLIASIRALISTVGDNSNLILDPDLDSYYTMDAVLIQLPSLWNALTDLSVNVHSVLSTKSLPSVTRASLTLREGQILQLDDNITRGFNTAINNNPAANLQPAIQPLLDSSRASLNTLLSKLDLNVLQAPSIALNPDSWLDTTRATLDASYTQWSAQADQLDTLLAARVSTFESNRTTSLIVALVALLLVVYFWVGFYRAVILSVTNLEKSANLLASGNFPSSSTTSLSPSSRVPRDELSQRAAAAISKVASATSQINSAIEERTSELTEVSYLLAYMHDGVIITDHLANIKVLNGTATRILNTEYDAAIAQPLPSLLPDPRLQSTIRAAIAAPTQRFAVDLSINNRLISVTVTFVTIESNTTGLFVLQDVTELRTLQQQQQFVKASMSR